MDSTEKLRVFLENDPNIAFALVFGSIAKGQARKGSDIDLGIYFVSPPEGLELLDLVNTLSNSAGCDVDIVVLNTSSAILRHQVMLNKIVLTIKDKVIYRKFRERTISDYDEYKYVSGMSIYDR